MKLSSSTYQASELHEALKGPQGSQSLMTAGSADTVESEALLGALVDLIPNDRTDRDYWVNVAHAVKGASGGAWPDVFFAWAARWTAGIDDPAANQKLWDGLGEPTIGRGWLLREAGLAGEAWLKEEARAVFDDGTVHPEDTNAAPKDASAFKLTDPKKIKRRPWLYDRRLMRGYLSATFASGGMGKSSLVMTEVIAMVSGRDLIGAKPRVPLRVWLWNGEDDLLELSRRLHAICLHFNINNQDLGDRLFVDSGREKNLVLAAGDGRGMAVNAKAVEGIKAVIKARRIDVLVIDPFVSAHRVGENDNMAIDLVAKTLSRIAEECHCAVDIVHHTRKPANGAGASSSVDDARGASALVNATRHSRVISPMPPSVALKLGITNHKAYIAVQHETTKANMVPPGVGAAWYKFESVGLGNGDPAPADGFGAEPEDAVGVVTRFTLPSMTLAEDPARIRAAQDEIAKGNFRSDPKSDDWVGPVIAGALGVDILEPGNRKLVVDTLKEWERKGWLKIEEGLDANRHKRMFARVGNKVEIDVFGDPASVASVD